MQKSDTPSLVKPTCQKVEFLSLLYNCLPFSCLLWPQTKIFVYSDVSVMQLVQEINNYYVVPINTVPIISGTCLLLKGIDVAKKKRHLVG